MQLVSLEAVLATVWISAVLIAGLAGNLNSLSSWAVLAGVAVLPPNRHDVAVERSSPKSVREHSGGTPMTDQPAIVADPEAELRWRKWQARGAEGDRRTAKRMRGLMILIAAAFLVWFVVQLA